VTASVEADIEDIQDICGRSPVPVEVIAHGSIEVMTAEHALGDGEKNEPAPVRYTLVDPKGFRFPVLVGSDGRSHIYNSKELCLLEELPAIAEAGAGSIRLLLDLYAPDEVAGVVSVYRAALDELAEAGSVERSVSRSATVHPSFADHTSGHFYRPVL
jgi:U32 family peptidase